MNLETGSLRAVYGIHLFEDSGRDIARSRLSRECHFILRMIPLILNTHFFRINPDSLGILDANLLLRAR